MLKKDSVSENSSWCIRDVTDCLLIHKTAGGLMFLFSLGRSCVEGWWAGGCECVGEPWLEQIIKEPENI